MSKGTERTGSKETPQQEEILVVPREFLYPRGAHHGLRTEALEEVMNIISKYAQFLPRYPQTDINPDDLGLENDPSLKQIIPYLVFIHDGKIFLMQRKDDHAEKRLAGQGSLGIGGHLRRKEISNLDQYASLGEAIFAWAQREFVEEVDYQGGFKITVLGLINDDTAPVHAVHAGLALLVEGDSPEIRVKDEHKEGKLVSVAECAAAYDSLENWSKIVFDALKERALVV